MSSWVRDARRVIFGNPSTLAATAGLVVLFVLALTGQWLVPYDPLASDVPNALESPSLLHPFGTDQLGRDVFSRAVMATKVGLYIAFSAVVLSCIVGSIVGAIMGFWGGPFDTVVSRVVEVMLAFPLFVFAMALVAAIGNTLNVVVLATAIINLPFYIRIVRTEVRKRSGSPFIAAARMAGSSNRELLFVFLIPNVLPIVAVQGSQNLGWAILNVAGLSFIGLGVRPPTPDWGLMIAEGGPFIVTGEWWLSLLPGLVLVATIFCFNALGDGLRDILDPRRRT